jgi:hypothetical protein
LGLSVGTHTLSFTTIDGWTAPTNEIVTIEDARTTAITAFYTFVPNYGLVANGGFQTGDFTGWVLLNADSTLNFVDNGSQSGIPPQTGDYEAALGQSLTPGYLSQTLATVPGTAYALAFWLNCDGIAPNQFLVSWNGSSLFNQTNLPALGWTNLQFLVRAATTNSVLQFGFQDDNSYLALDDVSVLPAAGPVSLTGTGLHTNHFGFTLSGPSGLAVVIEASTNLANPMWYPIQTNTLSNGSSYFSDPQSPVLPARFFRVKAP